MENDNPNFQMIPNDIEMACHLKYMLFANDKWYQIVFLIERTYKKNLLLI